MRDSYTVYGAPASGSVPIEAALTLAGVPYEVVEKGTVQDITKSPDMLAVNPLGQVPALVLPTGEVMTESAAILIYLADQYPAAQLGPSIDDSRRPAFLRWMTFVSTAIYGLAWIRSDPMRLVSDERQMAVIQDRIADRRAECWRKMNHQIATGPFLMGNQLGVLDLYVATVSRWSPRRRRFYHEAPDMAAAVRLVDADPRLAALWEERFPFTAGWEE